MPYPSRFSSIKMINYSQLLLAKKKKNVQVIALILRGTARDKGKTNSRWFCLYPLHRMAWNSNGKTAETGSLSPRLLLPRPIIDLPENKSGKSMSRRRDSPRGITINNFYRRIKIGETRRRDRFRVRWLANFHYSPDWNSSRRNLSRPVSSSLYYAPRLHETRSNERKGGDCWT